MNDGGSRGRKIVWLGLDQALSGASNLVAIFFVARATSPSEFGAFSVVYVVYVFLLTLNRSAVGQPILIRANSARDDDGALRLSGIAGVFGFVLAACLGWATGQLLLGLVVGASLPPLLAQDTCRFFAIRNGRAQVAARADGAWLAGFLTLAFLYQLFADSPKPWIFFLLWALAGSLSASLLIGDIERSERPNSARHWVANRKVLVGGLSADTALQAGVGTVSIYALAAITTLPTVAGLRAGEAISAPLASAFQAVGLLGLAGLATSSRQAVRRRALEIWLALSGLTLVYLLVIVSLPASLGRTLLGANWTSGRSVVVPLLIGQFGVAFSTAVFTSLKARERVGKLLMLRGIAAPCDAIGILVGGVAAGAMAAAVGLLVSRSLLAVICAWSVVGVSRGSAD